MVGQTSVAGMAFAMLMNSQQGARAFVGAPALFSSKNVFGVESQLSVSTTFPAMAPAAARVSGSRGRARLSMAQESASASPTGVAAGESAEEKANKLRAFAAELRAQVRILLHVMSVCPAPRR